MKQLFLDQGALAIRDVCQPVLDEHSVLVCVSYSFMSSGPALAKIISQRQPSILNKIPSKVKKITELISGKNLNYTNLIIKNRLLGRVSSLGHSCSGVVIAVGAKVHAFRAGDFVACAGTDFANHSDIVCVPQNLVVRVRQEEHVKNASIIGIGAIALHSIERANLKIGQTVAVFGLELVGQLTMKLCQITGCNVIGIDSDINLLNKAHLAGLKSVYDLSQDNMIQITDVVTDYAGIDCAIITPDFAINNKLVDIVSMVKKNGKIVITGDSVDGLPVTAACRKEIDLAFVTPFGAGLFEQKSMAVLVDLIVSGRLDVTPFMQHEHALEDLVKALDYLQQRESLGVVIDYKNYEKLKNNLNLLVSKQLDSVYIPARREHDRLKIGIMGASRHTQLNIVPILAQAENTNINTIIDTDISRSVSLASTYKGAHVFSGNLSMFQNDDSDLIFISKDHEVDIDTVIFLLQQNKAVLAERPFVDTSIKLEKLEGYLKTNPKAMLVIGYNYRYCPFIQKIKNQLDKRSAPFILHYRVNMGSISQEQRFVGAWRFGGVMAHAAHILDLFYYLAGSKPLSVSVDSIRTPGESSFSTDNFAANISFADGSVCSLLFTTLGDPSAGKEKLELFFDGKSIIMTDYKNLIGYGVAPYFDEKDREPDLGVSLMLADFLSSVRTGNVNNLKTENLLTTIKLALAVDQMVY
jgi:predicted dehydrogenase/threonine dehydrogenase-like Zn-dependent dehydrogenase